MKPILILQHLDGDGPGYLGTWLAAQGLPFVVCNAESGPPFPASMQAYAGLAVLGGEMSANDPLPSLRQAEALIRAAMAAGLPVIGHCLGGQLMARALGARVQAAPAPEVGWQRLQVLPGDVPARWFGPGAEATVFHWHYESFELPAGATLLASTAACPHQAFAIGPHLAMQFHIEIDVDKVQRWSAEPGARWQQALQQHPATVQDGAAMRAALAAQLPAHQALAGEIYARWLQAVPR